MSEGEILRINELIRWHYEHVKMFTSGPSFRAEKFNLTSKSFNGEVTVSNQYVQSIKLDPTIFNSGLARLGIIHTISFVIGISTFKHTD